MDGRTPKMEKKRIVRAAGVRRVVTFPVGRHATLKQNRVSGRAGDCGHGRRGEKDGPRLSAGSVERSGFDRERGTRCRAGVEPYGEAVAGMRVRTIK